MTLWDKIKKDIKKGIDEGVSTVKQGAAVAVEKAGELAEEGKRRYKIFELKQKIHSNFTELGGKIYDLTINKIKNPLNDAKVKSVISSIKKLEAETAKLEKISSAKKVFK
ncbi:MAG: hypothetical protein LLF28_08450 [Nitrospiraceae bacterium]|nr:hypothetical protein [Nitrospiraceae bacterium]